MREDTFQLLKSYALLAPISRLCFPSPYTDDLQKEFIDQFILSKHFQTYTPAPSYQRLFWKWVIKCIEEQGEEVEEFIYSYYLSLPSSSQSRILVSSAPPSPSYITYFWEGSRGLYPVYSKRQYCPEDCNKCTLFESRSIIESGTTGLRTWAASLVLAEFLVSNKELLGKARILELGSGIGFLGIIVARLQIECMEDAYIGSLSPDECPSLYLTDLNERVLLRCEDNCRLPCNSISSHPNLQFKPLDWNDALDKDCNLELLEFLEEVDADLILGADLIYDSSIIPSLVAMLVLSLRSPKKRRRSLLAATLRNEATFDYFIQEATQQGLRVEEVELPDTKLAQFPVSQPDRIGESSSQIKIFSVEYDYNT